LILLALLFSVSLACVDDSDCGGPDQAGLCVAGTCQCGVGYAGAELWDPTSCSQVCVPPAVPDSVAFLNEPIIGLAAISGNLTLNVTMDVNSKQIPTTVAWQHPVTGVECDLMPGALGAGQWTQQVNDASRCDSVLVYQAPFSTETARNCWETLATRQETGALYQTTFNQYRSRVEVIQSGLAPFGQSVPNNKRQSADETSITRQFRREYTISVATQFSVISDEFQVVAGGRVLYRLVEIDYDLLNNQIVAVIETQVADTARLANSAVNSEASSGISSLNGAVTFDAACDPSASSPGNCNQFHRVPFADEPCAVVGAALVLDVEFQCADGSDAATCGYTNLPADRVYALPNLILDYDACPRAIEYGIDGAASSIRLYTDPGRTTDVTAPVLQGTILYGQCEIFPTANAEFESTTLSALKVFQVASPANLDLGDQLSSTFLTLTSASATQTSPASAVWQFSLDVDASFFDITETYFLEATIDLTFANTGSLTKRLIIPLLPGRKRSNTAVALIAAGAPRQAQEGNSDQVRSNIFKMQAEEREEENEAPVSGSASTAIIAAGAAIGAVALVAIAAILIVFAVKKRRRREEEEEEQRQRKEQRVAVADSVEVAKSTDHIVVSMSTSSSDDDGLDYL